MTPVLREQIVGLVARARPTEDEIQILTDGWDAYFALLSVSGEPLDDAAQEKEFDTIMRHRVQQGSISVVAPGMPGPRV